jgi:hypothetical protein
MNGNINMARSYRGLAAYGTRARRLAIALPPQEPRIIARKYD